MEYYRYFTFNGANRKVMIGEMIGGLDCERICEISEDILQDLSNDQFYLYQIDQSIFSESYCLASKKQDLVL